MIVSKLKNYFVDNEKKENDRLNDEDRLILLCPSFFCLKKTLCNVQTEQLSQILNLKGALNPNFTNLAINREKF